MELSLAKPLPRKALMLKDHLLDDFSSCSSSGFPSYPRSQCCTTVRFLVELDLKAKPPKYKKRPLPQSPLKPASTTSISAFRRASKAVINAVKHLPFASLKSSPSSSSKLKLGILPRTLSRKLLKRNFWKKNDHKEIRQWKPIEHLSIEKPSPQPDFIITVSGDSSNSSTSDSNSKSNSWSDSDFTTSDDSLLCSTANSATNSTRKIREEVAVETNKKLPKAGVISSKRLGVIVGDADDSKDATTSSNSSTNSSNTTKKQWANEEKEQTSPVSVLDCPFDDEDDEVSSSSPFDQRLARMEGTKKKFMKKIRRFERLTKLEPVNLMKRIAVSESDQESNESPLHHSFESIQEYFLSDIEVVEEKNQDEEKAFELLDLIKDTMPSISIKLNVEKLLLDFFKMEIDNSTENAMGLASKDVTLDNGLLHIAKAWLNGQPIGKPLERDVQKNGEAYIQDMERGGEWRNSEKEKQELALEIEVEVFASLVNELSDDLLLS